LSPDCRPIVARFSLFSAYFPLIFRLFSAYFAVFQSISFGHFSAIIAPDHRILGGHSRHMAHLHPPDSGD
jgi:hypothetical protein